MNAYRYPAGMAGNPNWSNRTLFTGDNLDVMRGMNSETVDLVYLDPPFNSQRDYAAPIGSQAAGAEFTDTWTLDDVKQEWTEALEAENPALWHTIIGAGYAAGDSMQAYLAYMSIRLIEIHRVLKPTGSVYLHCDPHASHYLKQLLDCVFGQRNFRNEIVWKRTSTKSLGTKRYARDSDRILYYSKSSKFVWNQQYQPHDPEYVKKSYRYEDEVGVYRLQPLTGGKAGGPLAYEPFNGVLPSKGRAWAPPQRDKFPIEAAERLPDEYEELDVLAKCSALDDADLIYWSKNGIPNYKSYLDIKRGNPASDIITYIPPAAGDEATGYPTQKPLALVKTLIEASSSQSDIVLDPFCGCATTCVAAEMLDREWVGIDIEEKARDLVEERCFSEVWSQIDATPTMDKALKFTDGEVPTIISLDKPPKRTDLTSPLRSANIKDILYERQGGRCAANCEDGVELGRQVPKDLLEMDHIRPKSRGGADTDENLQLLCSTCNRSKGNRTMTWLLNKQAQGSAA